MVQNYNNFTKYAKKYDFLSKNLVSSKKSSTFAIGFETNHVFLAQLVEQLTLNQWVQGSSPWEDTEGYPKGYPFFVCIVVICVWRIL